MRFKRNFALTAMVIVLALIVAACGGKKEDDTAASNGAANNNQVAANDAGSATGSNDTAPQTITIGMEMMAYDPKEVTIPPGTTVRFVNNESFPMDHDVVQGTREQLDDFLKGEYEPLFQSPVIKPGEAWEYTFNEEGEFAYGCTQFMHYLGGMVGTIIVKAGAEVPADLI